MSGSPTMHLAVICHPSVNAASLTSTLSVLDHILALYISWLPRSHIHHVSSQAALSRNGQSSQASSIRKARGQESRPGILESKTEAAL